MRLVASLLLLVSLGGCAGKVLPPAPAVSNAPYLLGRGDRIRVAVYGQPALAGDYAVSGSGEVSLPLLGTLSVKGMTIEQFRNEVSARLGRDFFRNPQVTAEVASFRPVYILGEVTAPGEFRFEEGMTVYSLAARAGGFTYRADRKRVYIRHDEDAEEAGFALGSGSAVLPGDTIRIAERIF